MAKNNNLNQRGRHDNNPEGHNQYSNRWIDAAREHPVATAAAAAGAAGAVAAGVYLWSHRSEVGNQVNKISRTAGEMSRRASRKAGEWTDKMRSNDSGRDLAMTSGPNESSAIEASRRTSSQRSATRGQARTGAAQPVG
ncbi:MAG TPA: hypothetical protein VMK31_00480 [Sphingomicrobium sp.]|nr:hypothetical protein [Sphingomicrobium sp.]